MRFLIILLAGICATLSSSGQQYLVRYDIVAEELKYFKIKKKDTIPVSMIYLDGSNRVNLQVINIASSFRQQVVIHEKAEPSEVIQIPGIGGESFQGIQSLFKSGTNISADDILKNVQGENKMNNAALNMAAISFANNYNRFNENYEKWITAVKQLSRFTELWKDLASLRYSLQYDASTLKQAAFKKTKPVIPELVTDSVGLPEINATDPSVILLQMKESFKQVKESYEKISALGGETVEANTFMEQLNMQLSKTESYSNNNPVSTDDLISRITKLYQGIMSDKYSQLTNLPVNRKTVMAELQLFPNIDTITAAAIGMPASDTIIRLVPIVKKEPMRFRNTVGFGFISMPENRWSYYVAPDSTVARSSGDAFQPLIATYLHFYSMKDKGIRWGGSFGAGIPLSGDDKQLNLMLGLSTFFGKNDPVCLTLGIAGAKVNKLMEVKLGDKLSSAEVQLPYNKVYRIGYFLSLSFNPSALNSKD